jgi:hypothetical protein
VTTTAQPLWVGLVDGLAAEGMLSKQWRAVFLAVSREMFLRSSRPISRRMPASRPRQPP